MNAGGTVVPGAEVLIGGTLMPPQGNRGIVMRKSILLMTAAAVALVAFYPATAATKVKPKTKIVTAHYDLAMVGVTDSFPDPRGGGDGSFDIGGVNLAPLGGLGPKVKMTVTAKDDLDLLGTHQVWISACQDSNGNTMCGESSAHEPDVFGCVTPAKGLILSGIDRRKPVVVFVYTASGCPKYNTDTNSFASATSGTIKGVYTY
jgi:hypothetical protein